MEISARLIEVPSSPIRKLLPLAQKAKSQGVTVFHLNIGDPDIKTPLPMIKVLKNWQINPIGYDLSQGNSRFIQSLLFYYHQLGHGFLDEKNIQVTTGGSEAIAMAMFAVANPGDEILVFEPFYANYNSYAVTSGIRLVPITTNISDGFHLPPAEVIRRAITTRTRAILYCNPNNPTGTVYTQTEIEMLVDIARKYKIFLLSDEVYREYVFDHRRQISLFNYMEKNPQNTLVLDSMSKRYSACGLRLGTLVTLNDKISSGVLKIAQGRLSCGLIDQEAASALSQLLPNYYTQIRDEFARRRDVLYPGLQAIPGVVIPKPEGAFYVIARLPVDSSERFCQWLLTDFRHRQQTVMLAPASGFYATGKLGQSQVRIAYVLNCRKLARAVELLKLALQVYPNTR
ncbi:hypothetical protein A2154_02475 [Candidatus Gottesmanbacteria bacterium RBG_16_43_7]|uniref:Aminotransferase n=1 Tax=Candidatus Gottesmanbacteria bacterium RBG_16_43_7 TaxID=1798373 RepID=A0A1F5ZC98_9BACT|nr:MAG: hypothetical protein A2154_02475 [Candidatus Gottesmanbacteria bacterium RBG_16_43_7]